MTAETVALHAIIAERDRHTTMLQAAIAERDHQSTLMSRTWRYTRPLRAVFGRRRLS